jgi:hypothetical protein
MAMKGLFLRTWTPDCEKHWISLSCLGHQIETLQYDNLPHEQHDELVTRAKEIAPDLIVHIGALEQYHLKPVPVSSVLKKFRDIAPTMHLCSDASDYPWWPTLEEYDKTECFDIQVSIDGNYETPLANFKNGVVKLTPTDPSEFSPLPWEERSVIVGLTGGLGHHERAALIAYLTASPDVQWNRNTSYSDMCKFMCRSKISVNHSMNGTGDKFHVKGRVIETAWAGACLLERRNKHTEKWFKPGVDYLDYEDFKEAYKKIEWAKVNDSAIAEMADRFCKRVQAEHHPAAFWKDIFERVGIKDEVRNPEAA